MLLIRVTRFGASLGQQQPNQDFFKTQSERFSPALWAFIGNPLREIFVQWNIPN